MSFWGYLSHALSTAKYEPLNVDGMSMLNVSRLPSKFPGLKFTMPLDDGMYSLLEAELDGICRFVEDERRSMISGEAMGMFSELGVFAAASSLKIQRGASGAL